MKLKKFRFILYNAIVNEEYFFDFIDNSNFNSNIKKEYNNYIKNHPINKNVNFHVYKLIDIMRNYVIDKNNFLIRNHIRK